MIPNYIKNKAQQYSVDFPHFDYDHQVLDIDIKTKRLEDTQLLRGPLPSKDDILSGNYFVTIGSAHTFGRFSNKTYGQYISEKINIPCLNAGVSDASPHIFCRPEWLKYINKAKFVIIQMLSGRTGDNHIFYGGNIAKRKSHGACKKIDKMLSIILKEAGGKFVKRLIKESKEDFINQYIQLKKAITVPKIHLWHSVRKPEDIENLDNACIEKNEDFFRFLCSNQVNQFPHLIDRQSLTKMVGNETLVEYVSSKGFPQFFYDDNKNKVTLMTRTGVSWPYNNYYPTQEQHGEVAELLTTKIQNILTT